MAWEKVTYGPLGNQYPALQETVTLPDGASTDVTTSPITPDLIPPGKPVSIFANTGATNLASAAAVDLQISLLGQGGPFVTLAADLVAAIDNAQGVGKYDQRNTAGHALAPAWRLLIDSAGNQSEESVTFVLVFSDEDDPSNS